MGFDASTIVSHWLSAIRGSIVVSMLACHAGDRGSIPRHGVFSFCLYIYCLFLLLLWVLITCGTFYFIILLLMK